MNCGHINWVLSCPADPSLTFTPYFVIYSYLYFEKSMHIYIIIYIISTHAHPSSTYPP